MKKVSEITPQRTETQLPLPHLPAKPSELSGNESCDGNSTQDDSPLNLVVSCSECGTAVVINLDQLASKITIDTGALYGRETNGLHPRRGRANASGTGDDSRSDAIASLTDKEKAYVKGFLAGCAATQAALESDYREAKNRLKE